jgi:DNA-binding MarR family transcriptional regulator
MTKLPRKIYLLRQTQLMVYAEMIERLKAFDLTPAQYLVLSLSSSEEGSSSADLARRSQTTPQSMNEIIGALNDKGLIRRREDPDNRRILRVIVTRDGAKLLADCNKQIDRMENEIFRCLSERERATFRTLHTKLLKKHLLKIERPVLAEERPLARRAI